MKRAPTLLLIGCLLAAAGCGREAATVAPTATATATSAAAVPASESASAPDAEERARAAGADFSARLKNALMAELQSGGPVAAVDFCHVQAPRMADEVARAHGVRLGRVSVPGRNRNPAQDPTGWQLDAVQGFQRAVDAGAPPAEQVMLATEGLPQGIAARFAKGIAVEPPCLACHGKQLAPPLQDALAAHYPGDRATGFEAGDLRGLLWVEVPVAAGAPAGPDHAREKRQ